MTRENKLALVIGFGLILFVGILVSDHFSPARLREAAELTGAVDPLNEGWAPRTELLAMRPARTDESAAAAPPAAAETDPARGGSDFVYGVQPAPRPEVERPAAPERIVMGASTPEIVAAPDSTPVVVPVATHEVRRGETLTEICTAHYHEAGRDLVTALARFNGLDDASMVRSGARLRLPPRELLDGRAPIVPVATAPRTPTASARVAAATDVHRVAANENLSKIAARRLGKASRYREIFELNRDQLKDPDDVRAGMVLRLPPR